MKFQSCFVRRGNLLSMFPNHPTGYHEAHIQSIQLTLCIDHIQSELCYTGKTFFLHGCYKLRCTKELLFQDIWPGAAPCHPEPLPWHQVSGSCSSDLYGCGSGMALPAWPAMHMDVILLFPFSGDTKNFHHLVRLHRSRSTRSWKQNKQPDAFTGDVWLLCIPQQIDAVPIQQHWFFQAERPYWQ